MAYEELKQRQSVMWGNGPYQRITQTLEDIHERVIDTLAPAQGNRWLDVACGTGAIAERGAAAGADVTGLDLSPALIETAKERAAERGLDIDYVVGDVEAPPLRRRELRQGVLDGRDHVRAGPRRRRPGARARHGAGWADRARQLDSAGRTREDVQNHGALPTGAAAQQSLRLGEGERVRELLGDDFDLDIEEHVSTLRMPSAEDYWELFVTSYGPTKTLAEAIGDRREDLHRDWIDFFETNYDEDGEIVHTREYLLISVVRR